jgi:6-phosphogluconolactonase (cycloisomerase 2 family)
VSSFLWDDSNGDLRATGYSVPGVSECDFVAVHPGGQYVYVADASTSEIELLAADATSGRLTTIGSSWRGAGRHPRHGDRPDRLEPVRGDGRRRRAAARNRRRDRRARAALAALVTNVTNCAAIAVSPRSDFVYVGDENTDVIAVFARNPTTGKLVLANAQSATAPPSDRDLARRRAPVLGLHGSADLDGFSIDGSTGALTATPWSPLTMANVGARALEITADGDFLYAASNAVAELLQYSLTPVTGAPVALGTPAVSLPALCVDLAADPFSQFVYACLSNAPLASFSVSGATGDSRRCPRPSSRCGRERRASRCSPRRRPPCARRRPVRALGRRSGFAALVLVRRCDRRAHEPDSVAVSTNTCWGLDCHPTLATLYGQRRQHAAGHRHRRRLHDRRERVARRAGQLRHGHDGRRAALRAQRPLRLPIAVGLEHGARLPARREHGALSASGTAAVQANPSTLAVDPTGALLAVPNDGSSSVTLLTIDHDDGSLSFVSNTTTAVSGATRAFFHPSGRFLYVTGESAGVLVAFAVDHQAPALTALGLQPACRATRS